MAFELPILPFPKDVNQTPYIASPDTAEKYTVPASQWFKNASGLWVPVSATDRLPVDAQVTGRKLALPAPGNYDQVLNIAVSGSTAIAITPSAGEIWRVKLLRISLPAPVGAGSGNHNCVIRMGANEVNYTVLGATANYNQPITVTYNHFDSTTTSEAPTSESDQQRAINNLVASNTLPLYVVIGNFTNVIQSGTVTLRLIKEVEYIVS